jgi:putative aminopeptidase FrvX
MSIDFPLLKKISEVAGAPGFEDRVRKLVIDEIKGLVDDFHVDRMGNLICLRKGEARKKVMATAHLDEISFIVTHVDKNGFVKFHTLGGFDPKTLTAQRVIIHTKTKDIIGVMGAKPVHVMSDDEKKKLPRTQDYFIDLGMEAAEVQELVAVGDPITRERELIEMGNCVNGKSLDNRVAVYILVETLKKLKGQKIPYDFYAVFTTQEEVGIRGAQVAAHSVNPDYGICIDITIAFDTPGAKDEEMVTKLGQGTAIKIMDASVICDRRMVSFLKQVASESKIKHQMEILTAGGTDSAGMQRMAQDGCVVSALSIPTRHVHQSVEMCHKQDISDTVDLLSKALLAMDRCERDFILK